MTVSSGATGSTPEPAARDQSPVDCHRWTMHSTGTSLKRIVMRGFRKRCPRCGLGRLFAGWYSMHDRCASCGLEFEPEAGSTWAFMYVTTAGITGVIIVAMLMIDAAHSWVWRLLVLPIALVAIGGTLPIRKSLAVALEYVISLRIDPDRDGPGAPPR